MNKAKQDKADRPKVEVIYVPPLPEELDDFTYRVCSGFQTELNMKALDTDFRHGFSRFIEVAVKIATKKKNMEAKHEQ
jgi:hypothetical protein